jgi:hypothetical protein
MSRFGEGGGSPFLSRRQSEMSFGELRAQLLLVGHDFKLETSNSKPAEVAQVRLAIWLANGAELEPTMEFASLFSIQMLTTFV